MSSFLIAESGSTKTDWCLLRKTGKPVFFKTQGINPYIQNSEAIAAMLQEEFPAKTLKTVPDAIYYYGAGASAADKQKQLQQLLRKHFGVKDVKVQSDLTAAAQSLCGTEKGIVAILGTGSASCFYIGSKIAVQQPSLGYIAGDEGSGNYIGKRVLQYYAYGTFDAELKTGFELRFGKDIQAIIGELYSAPYPNRYLASFVPFINDMRGHYMAENIIEDCLNDFFHHNLLKYRQSWTCPLHFSGSVAYTFRDVIESLCNQYELELGKIVQSPMEGLIKYHRKNMS
jgi:N-acetylglucosamine kinase-like BadF-type ATPase